MTPQEHVSAAEAIVAILRTKLAQMDDMDDADAVMAIIVRRLAVRCEETRNEDTKDRERHLRCRLRHRVAVD